MQHSEKVRMYDAIAQALAFNSEELDQFNRDIQWEIEHAAPDEALELATIKLNANRSFYRAVHHGG